MRRRAWWSGMAGLLGLALLASGWTAVGPGEVVVVRRLGRVLPEPWTPGSHWGWPLGIDRATRLRLDEVRIRPDRAGRPGGATSRARGNS